MKDQKDKKLYKLTASHREIERLEKLRFLRTIIDKFMARHSLDRNTTLTVHEILMSLLLDPVMMSDLAECDQGLVKTLIMLSKRGNILKEA